MKNKKYQFDTYNWNYVVPYHPHTTKTAFQWHTSVALFSYWHLASSVAVTLRIIK